MLNYGLSNTTFEPPNYAFTQPPLEGEGNPLNGFYYFLG
jgi:hypothetical protein